MSSLLSLSHPFLEGLCTTLSLFFSTVLSALIIAVCCTYCYALNLKFFKPFLKVYLLVIRGSPLLVQLFLIYYGLGQWDCIKTQPWLWNVLKEPWITAWLAFSLNSGAYTTLLFKETLDHLDQTEPGQYEAGLTLGLSPQQAFRKILFPQVWHCSLNAYSNEVVFILKATALASTISIMDLTGAGRLLVAETYNIDYLIITALIYLVLNSLILTCFKWITALTARPTKPLKVSLENTHSHMV